MTVVYTHIDADGITSARIIYHALKSMGKKVAVVFSHPFNYFDGEDIKALEALLKIDADKSLIVVDIPVSSDGVEAINDMLADEKVSQVTWIDHHPTDVDVKSVTGVDFRIIHDQSHCAATLAAKIYHDVLEDRRVFWVGYWAIVGAFGDVANELSGAIETMNTYLEEASGLQVLLGDAVYWDGRNERTYPIASMVASFLNTPRRMFFDKGARVAYRALSEIEAMDDPMAMLYDPRDTPLEAKIPNVSLLHYWKEKWLTSRRDVFKKGNIDFYHLSTVASDGKERRLGVAIISHSWDIGGYVAGVKGQDIPAIVINIGLPYPYIKLSARGPANTSKYYEEWDFSRFFSILEGVSGGRIRGGGHRNAGAATAAKDDITGGQIVRYLWMSLNEYYR